MSMAKRKPAKARGPIVKLPRPDMSFEDVVRHVLKSGPMPKKAARPKRRKVTASSARSKK